MAISKLFLNTGLVLASLLASLNVLAATEQEEINQLMTSIAGKSPLDMEKESDKKAYGQAMNRLIQMGEPVLPALEKAYANPKLGFDDRSSIILLAGEIGKPSAIPMLLKVIDDDSFDNNWFRNTSAPAALAKIGKESVRPLLERLNRSSHYVKIAAARTLGLMREDSAVEPLIALAADESVHRSAREEAILALGRIGSERALAALEKIKSSGKPNDLKSDAENAIKMIADFKAGKEPYKKLEKTGRVGLSHFGKEHVVEDLESGKTTVVPQPQHLGD